jgi:hypothetical protein
MFDEEKLFKSQKKCYSPNPIWISDVAQEDQEKSMMYTLQTLVYGYASSLSPLGNRAS